MRRLLAPLLLLVFVAPAAADEKKPAPRTAGQAADKALAAFEAKDRAALKALAAKDKPDPWLVADELCYRGEHDAAEAFAKAAPRKATEALPGYVSSRRGKAPDEDARKALAAERKARSRKDDPARFAAVEGIEADLDTVAGSQVAFIRGMALRGLRRLRESEDQLLAAAKAAQDLGWLKQASLAFHEAGVSAYYGSRWHAAIEAWARRRELSAQLGDRQASARGLMNLGAIHQVLGDYTQALRLSKQALVELRAIGDDLGAMATLGNVGDLQLRLGRYADAIRALEETRKLQRATGNTKFAARALMTLSHVYRTMGDTAKALRLLETAREELQAAEDRQGAVRALVMLGTLNRHQGNYEEAISLAKEALEEMRLLGDKVGVAAAIGNIGAVHYSMRNYDAALPLYEESLAQKEALDDRIGAVQTLNNIGVLHLRRGDFERAGVAYDTALGRLDEVPSPPDRANALWGLAGVRLGEKQPARAVAMLREAVGIASKLATGLAEGEGAGARDVWGLLFERALGAAFDASDTASLAWFLEQGRAGSLREALGSREALEAAVVPAKLREALTLARSGEQRALAAYRRTARSRDLAATRSAREAWLAKQTHVGEVMARIERGAKAAAAVTLGATDELAVIRGTLGPGEALVYYGLAEARVIALVVRPKGARRVGLAATDEVMAAVKALRSDPDKLVATGAVAPLRQLVIDPLKLGKDVERVLVSPVGQLGYVPFALLIPNAEIAYVPSGTTYGLLLEEREKRGRRILALGDPDYRSNVDRAALSLHRGGEDLRLTPLPATRAEVEAVGDTKLLGREASETALGPSIEKEARWRALHFACHGLVRPERPRFSALALTADKENDGFLTALEIFAMKIPADLVVLSACDTAKGKIFRTEGIVGLTRAFMFAGAPRVICSLWKVDDAATKALMIKFYELWHPKEGKGLGAAAALRKAQEHVRSHDDWKHPYYWAAWVLWGLPE